MAKNGDIFVRKGVAKPTVLLIVFLLILLAAFFSYNYFVSKNKNHYLIKNKYYGFELKTPKDWVGEENTSYSEDSIERALDKCKDNKLNNFSAYEIGVFRFKNQKYPQEFGYAGYFPSDAQSGAILEIAISCTPSYMKNKVLNYNFDSLKIDGEKALEGFWELFGFGKIKYLSFSHNNLEYKINEYIYISPDDKKDSETEIRNNYAKIFNKITSSFKFIN